MKILLITDGIFPYVMGGMQKHSYNLVKYLVNNNNEVTLLHCVSQDSDCPNDLEIRKLVLDGVSNNFTQYCMQFPKAGRFPGHYLRNSKRLSRKYWEKIGDQITDYDFIFSQGFSAWEFLKNKEKCPPIGIHFHGYNSLQQTFGLKQKLESILLNREIRAYANKSDYLFSLGGNMTNLIMEKVPFPYKKILSSMNGIEEHWLLKSKKEFTDTRKFLFVGRPNKIKAIDLIYNGIKSLKSSVEFHFVGDFPEEFRLNLPNVKYWGEVNEEESLKSIYRDMDVLLCPSYSEGLPTVILEAMAMGLPIIATNVGAVDEVVNNEMNGLLIPSGNGEELLKALTYYTDIDLSKLEEQSLAAKETIGKKFLWQNVIQETMESIKGAIVKP